jgi:hypothetical protein
LCKITGRPTLKALIIKNIDDTLYKAFKIKCMQNDLTVKDKVIELMTAYITKSKKEEGK